MEPAPNRIYFKPHRQEDTQINTDFHFQEWAFLAKVEKELPVAKTAAVSIPLANPLAKAGSSCGCGGGPCNPDTCDC